MSGRDPARLDDFGGSGRGLTGWFRSNGIDIETVYGQCGFYNNGCLKLYVFGH